MAGNPYLEAIDQLDAQRDQIEPGNIDLSNRPRVIDPANGKDATVRSVSFGTDQGEVLIPTVTDEGTIVSDEEAISRYRKTGKHLGIFKTPQAATAYAQLLHGQQEQLLAAGPNANPYLAAVDQADEQLELQRDNDVADLFKRAQLDMPVEKRAGVLRLAKESGLTSLATELNYDAIKASYQKAHGEGFGVFDARGWRKANPELAKLVLEQPDVAPVVMRSPELSIIGSLANRFVPSEADLENLQKLSEATGGKGIDPQVAALRLFGLTEFKPGPKVALAEDNKSRLLREGGLAEKAVIPIARYLEAEQGLEISKKQFLLMAQRARGADTYELEKELIDLKREHVRRNYGEGSVGQVFSDVAEAAASSIDVLETGGLAGAAGGAAYGGLAYVLTRSKAAAGRAFVKGAAVAGKAGAVLGTFRLEAGDAYGQLVDAKTDDGKPLDNDVATGAALIYGTLAAGIEFASWGPLFKSMGPLGALIQKGEKEAALKAMVKHPTFRAMAKRAAKNWLAASAAEGGEEGLQAFAQDTVDYFARSFQQGELSIKGGPEGEKVFSAAQKGFVGGAGMATVAVATDALQQGFLRDNSIEGAQKVLTVASTSQSQLLQASAEGYGQVVENATGKTGKPMTHAYVDARGFEREAMASGVDPAAAAEQLLGKNGRAQLAAALETGGKLEVPVAAYAPWSATELGQKLLQDTQASPDLMTVRQLAEQMTAEKESVAAAAEAETTAAKVQKDFDEAGASQQLVDLYGDEETGLLNEQGYQLAPVPAGYAEEATFELEGQKFFNDLAHDYTTFDAALRRAAAALQKESPVAARVGGALKARVRDAGEAERIASKLTKALGGKVRVTVAATKEQARAGGTFAHRGSPPVRFLQPGEHDAFGRVAAAGREAVARVEAALKAGQEVAPEDSALAADLQLTSAATARAAKDTAELVAQLKAAPASKVPRTLPVHAETMAKMRPGEASRAANVGPQGLFTGLGWRRLRKVAKKAHVAFADARGFGDMRNKLIEVLGKERGESAMDELSGEFFASVRAHLDQRDDAARLNPRGDELLAQTEDKRRLDADLTDLAEELKAQVFYAVGPAGRVFVQRGLQFVHGLGTDEDTAKSGIDKRKSEQVVRKPEVLTAAEWERERAALPREPRQLGVDPGVGRTVPEGSGRTQGPSSGGGASPGGPRGSEGARSEEVVADAVEQAERSMGLLPLFRSAAEAGMDAEAWQRYLEVQERARSHAGKAARKRALEDAQRRTERWWKEQEAKERAAAATAYDELQPVRALQALRGEDEIGLEVPLDRAAVEAAIGREAAVRVALPLADENGALPDEVADAFGYATGEELLGAIARMPTREKFAADAAAQAMEEKYPDVGASRQQLRDAAAQDLHGQFTEKWLLENLKALRELAHTTVFNPETSSFQGVPNERLGKPATAAQDARRRARDLVSDYRIGALRPGYALQLEREAGRAALEAAGRKNYDGAFAATLKQLLNMNIWKEVVAARDERIAFIELAQELASEKSRAAIRKAAPQFADAVDLVLEALRFKEPEQRTEPLPSVGDVVAMLEEDEASAMFDEDVVNEVVRRPPLLRDLTVGQMRELVTYLENVQAAARVRSTAVEEGRRVEKAQALAELTAEAEANRAHTGPVSSSESAEGALELLARGWTEFDGSGLRPEMLAKWLGGAALDSAWRRYVVDPLQKAKHRKAAIIKKVIAPIAVKLQEALKDGRFMAKVDGKALFPGHRDDLEPPRYAYEIFTMLLHAGTESSWQRLRDGRGITEEQLLAAVNKHLWPSAVKLVQAVWDANESLWADSKALEERMSGVAPPKLEPRPLSTAHGELAGGYMPAKYDSRVEQVGELQEGQALGKVLDPSYVRPGTDRSRMKRRAENFAGALTLEPGLILRALDAAAHDIAYREALKSVAGLIWDPKLQRVLRERLGTGRANQFKQWLRDVGTQAGANLTDWWSKAGRAIKKRTVVAALAYRLPTALGDLSNFMLGLRRLGAQAMLAGISEVWQRDGAYEFALKKSAELSSRKGEMIERFAKDLELVTKRGGKARAALSWFDRHGFTIYEWTERLFSVPAWYGAYRQALARGEPDSAAVKYADTMVRRMLPSWNPVDQSAIQRNRYLSPFLMFGSFHNIIWNEVRDELEPISQALLKGEKATAAKRAAVAIPAVLFIIASSYAFGELLSGRGPEAGDGDDEAERWIRWLARKMVVGAITTLPVVGQEAGSTIEHEFLHKQANPRGGLYTSWIAPMVEASSKMLDGEKSADEKLFALYLAIAPLLGTPTYPLVPVKYLTDVAQGDVEPRGPGDVAGGAVYGEKKSGAKNPFTVGQDLAR